METDGSPGLLLLRNPACQVSPALMDKAVSSPRPPPSFQGQGGPAGNKRSRAFFLRASKFWERLGSWELQTWMSHARCQRSQPPAAPRLDAALPLPLNLMHALQSRRPLSGTIASFETSTTASVLAPSSVVVAGCRQKTQAESPQRTDQEKESKRGPPGRTFHSPESQPLLFLFGGLESLTGSTNRGQRPRMAGLKWTMLDLETGGMCANAAVRWRSQACVAACQWPYRSATSTTGEMSFSLASIQVPKPNGHS